ncbi:MAG: dihydrodipicolinate synthase family protein [Solirubrobacteraceae bacterium]|nr:dihydrodipicolinate synthase family protein [Solirubrobacteraceae bacterium]
MDRNSVDWKGYYAAVPTPFNEDGSLALDLLRELLELYVSSGLHGVLIEGTTGEWFSQSPEERRLVAETAVETIKGRIPVIVGCTDYTADLVAGHAEGALKAGADGIAATPPPYAKPFPEETVAWYEAISAKVDAPLMIYNWPHGTSVEIDTELARRLVEIDTVVAFKDSTPNVEQFYRSSRELVDKVRVFGPYMTPAGLEQLERYGGDGTIGGGSLFLREDAEFWEAHWRGDHDAALAHAIRNERLFPKLWLPGGWAGRHGHYASELKALMAILGQPGGTVRPPRLPITDPAKLKEMREILVEEGLVPAEAGS